MPGAGPALMAMRPTDIGVGEPFATFQPGYRFVYGDNEFLYVRFDNGQGNVASAAGGAAYWKDRAGGIVTSDKTDNQEGAANSSGIAGIFQGVTTDQYFTWLVTKGPYTVQLAAGDSNGAVGNKVFAPASDVDLTLRSEADSSVSSSEIPATEVGRQLAAGSANTALVVLAL